MNNRTMRVMLRLMLLVLSLLGVGALGAGCAVADVDAPSEEEESVGMAQEATTTAPAGDPRFNPTCAGVGFSTVHNPGWPYHQAGLCPAADEYTFGAAVAACGAKVKYFGYSCGNLSSGDHSWTAYLGCCAATCGDGIQNQGETGVDCGGPCSDCPVIAPEKLPFLSDAWFAQVQVLRAAAGNLNVSSDLALIINFDFQGGATNLYMVGGDFYQGASPNPDATITVSVAVAKAVFLYNDIPAAIQAFTLGQFSISGNFSAMQKLQYLQQSPEQLALLDQIKLMTQ